MSQKAWTAIGSVVVALGIVFGLMSGVPWASRGDLTAVKDAQAALERRVESRLNEIHQDIRELRSDVRQAIRSR